MPACVLAISRYYGVRATIRELRRLLVTDPTQGTSLRSLQGLACWFKVELGRILDLAEIPKAAPFIAYLAHRHAIVVWGPTEDGGSLVVGDPAVGIVEMRIEELLLVWDGIVAVLRPLDGASPEFDGRPREPQWLRWLHLSELRSLEINWWAMAWTGLTASILGAVNALYALYFPSFLRDTKLFIWFVLSYAATSGIMSWINNYVQYATIVRYQKTLAMRINDVLGRIDLHFYTMGDISTRYQDASSVISSVMGLFRDVPYAIMLGGASVYFLAQISWLLVAFFIAFLVLVISLITPLVGKVQQMVYGIRLKEADITNKIRAWLSGGTNQVTESYVDAVLAQYRQAVWSIPINSILGNSVAIPILFVVLFMHWQLGIQSALTSAGYAKVLSGIMMMSYAVSAGHSLYGKIVAWQVALPSLHRLRDFLGIEDGHPVPEAAEGSVTGS